MRYRARARAKSMLKSEVHKLMRIQLGVDQFVVIFSKRISRIKLRYNVLREQHAAHLYLTREVL